MAAEAALVNSIAVVLPPTMPPTMPPAMLPMLPMVTAVTAFMSAVLGLFGTNSVQVGRRYVRRFFQ